MILLLAEATVILVLDSREVCISGNYDYAF